MSTQTQTETFVLHNRASPEPVVHEPAQEPEPELSPKWRYPKVLSAGMSFFVAGVNDGSLGSLIPYVIRSYGIGTDMVAVM